MRITKILRQKKGVKNLNQEQIKEIIKELIQDETIQIIPLYKKNSMNIVTTITIAILVDGECIKEM